MSVWREEVGEREKKGKDYHITLCLLRCAETFLCSELRAGIVIFTLETITAITTVLRNRILKETRIMQRKMMHNVLTYLCPLTEIDIASQLAPSFTCKMSWTEKHYNITMTNRADFLYFLILFLKQELKLCSTNWNYIIYIVKHTVTPTDVFPYFTTNNREHKHDINHFNWPLLGLHVCMCVYALVRPHLCGISICLSSDEGCQHEN